MYKRQLGPLIKPTRGSRSDVLVPPERAVYSMDGSFLEANPVVADADVAVTGADSTPLLHAHL